MPSKSKSKKKKSGSSKKKGSASASSTAASLTSPSTASAPTAPDDPDASPLDNDPRFLREYSKSLADALRANERLPPPPPAKLVHSTYRDLCHDDPQVNGGDECCRLLAERLVEDAFGKGAFAEAQSSPGGLAGGLGGVDTSNANSDGLSSMTTGMSGMTMKRRGGKGGSASTAAAAAAPASTRPQSRLVVPTMSARSGGLMSSSSGPKYALSDRVLGGILQATDRTLPNKTAPNANKDDDDDDDDSKESVPESFVPNQGGQTAGPATSAGYAELAYAALVRGPVLCCRSANATNLEKTAAFLGSYGGHGRIVKDADAAKGNGNADKDKASKWEDEMLEKSAEQYIQSMIAMGKITGGANADSVLPPPPEDEKKEKESVDDDNGNNDDGEDWDSIGDSSSSSSGVFQQQQQQLAAANAETNSLEEIFAEESDPDDFEYESHHDPAAEMAAAVKFIEESFDPEFLSKPDQRLDWDGARERLSCLLEELAYNRLVSLSKSRWDRLGVSTSLVELARILLEADVATGVGTGSGRSAVIKTETLLRRPAHLAPSSALTTLTAQWSKPLSVLRDRALDSTYDYDTLDCYITFIKDLVNAPPRPGADSGTPTPTKVVGLSSLSSLCGYDGILRTKSATARRKVRAFIVDSIDGIIDLVEVVRQLPSLKSSATTKTQSRDLPSAFIAENDNEEPISPSEDKSLSEWIRVVVCALPVIQYLTNTQFSDFARLDWSETSETLSTQEAQALLSTGLFRELILLQTTVAEKDNNVTSLTRTRLLRAIFVLSAQSTTVLGKYSTRVPELTSQIHSDTFAQTHIIDSTLWAALSVSLQSSNKSALRLKAASTPPSIDKLQGNCLRGFATLCDRVEQALKVIISSTNSAGGDDEAASQDKSIEDAPYNFVEFTNCIASLPSVAKAWVGAVASVDGGSEKAAQRLETIRTILSSIPAKKVTTPPAVPGKDHDAGESKDDTTAIQSSTPDGEEKAARMNDEVVSLIRKGVKIMALLLECGPEEIVVSESDDKPVVTNALSSKTD